MAAKNTTIKRILKEAAEITTNPTPDFYAAPLEDDIFEWHFTIRGPPSPSPFADGVYHGRITLPPAYPLRPPSFRFLTPSGRFEPNREICLSISGHHEETWQPAWGIRTALVAIRSFMDTDAGGQVGGMNAAEGVRKDLAVKSRAWTCPACAKTGLAILEEQEERCKELGGKDVREDENALVGKIGLVAKKGDTDASATDSDVASSAPEQTPPASVSPGDTVSQIQQRPQPTPTTPLPPQTQPLPPTSNHAQLNPPPPTQAQPRAPLQQQNHPITTTTDAWIDKAIIGIVIALVLMILRRVA